MTPLEKAIAHARARRNIPWNIIDRLSNEQLVALTREREAIDRASKPISNIVKYQLAKKNQGGNTA